NGGTAPYWWTVVTTGGPLPPGLTLTTAGVLSGTPTSVGTTTFVIQALDNNAGAQGQATKSFALTVNPPFSPVTIINATTLPPAEHDQGGIHAASAGNRRRTVLHLVDRLGIAPARSDYDRGGRAERNAHRSLYVHGQRQGVRQRHCAVHASPCGAGLYQSRG